ncbi:MAG: hypothetical protein NVSMB16_12450 [Acidimicrobiales bacterium]
MTATAPGWAAPTTPLPTGALPDPGFNAPAAPASERGHTTIAPGVVSSVAARAALDVPSVLRSEPSGLARVLRNRPAGLPDATAQVDEGRASVQLKVIIAYPAPVWSTAEQIRDRVRQQVQSLTGLTVGEIDLEVALLRPSVTRRRVV